MQTVCSFSFACLLAVLTVRLFHFAKNELDFGVWNSNINFCVLFFSFHSISSWLLIRWKRTMFSCSLHSSAAVSQSTSCHSFGILVHCCEHFHSHNVVLMTKTRPWWCNVKSIFPRISIPMQMLNTQLKEKKKLQKQSLFRKCKVHFGVTFAFYVMKSSLSDNKKKGKEIH